MEISSDVLGYMFLGLLVLIFSWALMLKPRRPRRRPRSRRRPRRDRRYDDYYGRRGYYD